MEIKNRSSDPNIWIKAVIEDFINNSSENTLQNNGSDKAWAEPLVGFSKGDDIIYQEFKEHIGPFYWTPQEIFNQTFPSLKISACELTVVSWILPQTEMTKADNRRETIYPSERWVRSRIYGEIFNEKLRRHVVSVLKDSGYKALAPTLSPLWEQNVSESYGMASNWSERHAAYASGLGTFGLCDGLITPLGKAMRCGSVIANIPIAPTPRPYMNHHAYCLFFTKGICKKCILRCPAGAISEDGHNKNRCREYISNTVKSYVKANFGFEGYGCGLCQTAVPCESKIPTEKDI